MHDNEPAHTGPLLDEMEQMARENAELRADKGRLDWLDRNAHTRDRTLAIMERDGETLRWAGVEWDGTEETVREAIDAAMKSRNET